MAKKKKSGGGGDGCGGGGGGQQPKPAEEKAVGDHADERTAGCDKEKGKDKDKGKKAPPPPPLVTAVLKVDMHCDGCAKRIRASVRHYPGVEGVAMDVDKGTMTVVGRFDAKKLRDRVATKTKKKVELVVGNNNQQNKGKDDEAAAAAACNKKQQQHNDLKVVHEYGKPEDHMYWIDKVYNKAVQDKDKAKEDNKACGGGGGKAKDGNKGSGGGEGNKDDKGPGGDKGKGGKKPVVPVVGMVVLKIGAMGLHCDGCMNRVRTKLFKIKGVEQVSMDMGKNQVTVTGTMDVKALPGKLQKKVRRPVDVVPAANKEKDKDKQDGNKQQESCSKEGNNSKQDGGCSREKQDKDAATKALTAEMEMWKTAFYDQQSLLNTEFMLSDENPNACSVM